MVVDYMRQHRVVISVAGAAVFLLAALFWLTRPVNIGVIISTATSRGYDQNIAVRHYRTHGHSVGLRSVRYIIRNPAYERAAIVDAYRDLEDQGVVAVIGAAGSFEGIVLAEEAARSGIPTIALNVSTHFLDGKRDAFYRMNLSTRYQGRILARYAAGLGAGSVAVVIDDINRPYTEALAVSFEGAFTGRSHLIPFEGPDVTANAVAAVQPRCILLILRAQSMLALLNRLRPRLPGVPVISSPWGFQDLSVYQSAATRGVRTLSAYNNASARYRPEIDHFNRRFESIVAIESLSSFAAMDIILRALRDGGTSRAALRRYFDTPRIYEGISDRFFMDDYGDAYPPVLYVREITDEGIVTRETIPVPEYKVLEVR